MRILYAIQGTGNGHLARANEIAPELQKRADVDFLLSGHSSELSFPYPFTYNYHGLSFVFGNRGGIDYKESFGNFRPWQYWKDMRACPVEEYDVIINDFEPISAWAAKRKNVPVIALSHQASFYSNKVPLPSRRNRLFEWAMKKIVAPANDYVGVHYKRYDDNILPPIIRQEILAGIVTDKGHVTVYLPAFSDEVLLNLFNGLPEVRWEVFTKKSKQIKEEANVAIYPVDKERYSQSLLGCHGLLTGGGFQATSEALYLRKKLMVIPMYDQYEQKCNAAALAQFGVPQVSGVEGNFLGRLSDWLENSQKLNLEPEYSDASDVAQKLLIVAQGLVDN